MTSSAQRALAAALLCAAASGASAASASPRLCAQERALDAAQQDRLLRFAAVVQRELEASGSSLALVSRSGLNLARFGVRYTHAGVSLRASPNGAWSVRQLYYACDESRPRLFDQGLPGFLFGTDDPALGYASIVLLPREADAALERAALDRSLALRLLGTSYRANAHPYSLRHQNCNQWLIELAAAAWGGLDPSEVSRERTQRWLAAHGYAPAPVPLGSHLWLAASLFVPWLTTDDHPDEDLFALRYRTSLPASIEAFVRERWPDAQRIEVCHDARRIVVRRGWQPIADGCIPEAGDRVLSLAQGSG